MVMEAIDKKSLLQGLSVSVPLGIAMIALQPFGDGSVAPPLLVFAIGYGATFYFIHRNRVAKKAAEWAAYAAQTKAENDIRRATAESLVARGFRHYLHDYCDPREHDLVTFATVYGGEPWDAAPGSLDPMMNANGLYWRPVEYTDFEELPPQRVISHSIH
jgi:hypothetical protein